MQHEIFVPGRLCILGEHSDWGGSFRDRNHAVPYGVTVVCATNEGLYASCREYRPERIRFASTDYKGEQCVMEISLDVDELTKVAAESVRRSCIGPDAGVQ